MRSIAQRNSHLWKDHNPLVLVHLTIMNLSLDFVCPPRDKIRIKDNISVVNVLSLLGDNAIAIRTIYHAQGEGRRNILVFNAAGDNSKKEDSIDKSFHTRNFINK